VGQHTLSVKLQVEGWRNHLRDAENLSISSHPATPAWPGLFSTISNRRRSRVPSQSLVRSGSFTFVSQKSVMLITRLSKASNCTGLVRKALAWS
jgi:hypothetical protein